MDTLTATDGWKIIPFIETLRRSPIFSSADPLLESACPISQPGCHCLYLLKSRNYCRLAGNSFVGEERLTIDRTTAGDARISICDETVIGFGMIFGSFRAREVVKATTRHWTNMMYQSTNNLVIIVAYDLSWWAVYYEGVPSWLQQRLMPLYLPVFWAFHLHRLRPT